MIPIFDPQPKMNPDTTMDPNQEDKRHHSVDFTWPHNPEHEIVVIVDIV